MSWTPLLSNLGPRPGQLSQQIVGVPKLVSRVLSRLCSRAGRAPTHLPPLLVAKITLRRARGGAFLIVTPSSRFQSAQG